MDTKKYRKKLMQIILALAVFNFTFLGTEFLFDNMIGTITDPAGVTRAQNYVLGISAIGFILYPVLSYKMKKESRLIGIAAAMMVSCICIFVIQEHKSFFSVMLAGCVIFAIFGVMGSAICYLTTQTVRDQRNLAKYIGISYAFGVLIQFVNNNVVKKGLLESIVISVSILILGILILTISMKENDFSIDKNSLDLESDESIEAGVGKKSIFSQKTDCFPKQYKNPLVAGIALIITVLLMTCIFSTLDNAVTLVHASGEFDIGQWPRAILAGSGLLAGFLYDIHGRKWMNTIMYIVTLLSVICVVVINLGGSFVFGLIVFYISAGFFVVFFMTSFMDLSYSMRIPKLWAGLGRATNNVCALITTGITVTLLETGKTLTIMVASLVLFAFISASLIVYEYQLTAMNKEVIVVEKKETVYQMMDVDEEEKFQAFSQAFSLTNREKEVLKALLEMDENVQEIAENLAISRAALYRHITNLNEKTNTKSRIGIMQFYYGWKMK